MTFIVCTALCRVSMKGAIEIKYYYCKVSFSFLPFPHPLTGSIHVFTSSVSGPPTLERNMESVWHFECRSFLTSLFTRAPSASPARVNQEVRPKAKNDEPKEAESGAVDAFTLQAVI